MSETDHPAGPRSAVRLVDNMRFRQTFRRIPAPVAVVLVATANGGTTGITCTSAQSLSAEPPMAVVAIDDKTGLVPLIRHAGRFSINYLAADRSNWADAFSARGADLAELADIIVPGRTSVPTFATGTTAVLECASAEIHPGGDHWIVSGAIAHARFQADAEPLLYRAGAYGAFRPGGDSVRSDHAAVVPTG
ncbi:flavin reductase family protein [Prauserella muralis]|uniref:Uncharacterized protein n=1 Tax=Prauserella muralis TaxID=588067 RepID=A0A2V4AG58_9PSEU|nr:flavin reductase family protein [Prauserella muralis]PXY18912.1 hypothetical protein BAY60_29195 [Prauserella muralis]TWE28787.1 flavin reductase (DIM6/NTAB) family NADH-FMN oxidoreductase RutF [Prauserella muralis]